MSPETGEGENLRERERERERERVVLFCLSVDKLGTVMREREKKKGRPGFVEKWGWVIK